MASRHLFKKFCPALPNILTRCIFGGSLIENYRNLEVCDSEACVVDPSKPQPRVLIVGAGIAGISAAARLANCGIKNFILLEAKERPGGRIHSGLFGNNIIDLGAEWIEGGSVANPIYNFASQGGLLNEKDSQLKKGFTESSIYLTKDGRAIETLTVKSGINLFNEIKVQAEALFSINCDSKKNLRDFMFSRLQKELAHIPEETRFDITRVVNSRINCLKSRWGVDLSEISADEFGSLLSIPGDPFTIKNGMQTILPNLIKDIPPENISYQKTVQLIDWGDTCTPVKVTCTDGECFSADFCIVTVSLGVLKQGRLFNPELPDDKLEAIQNLGFGAVDKIFLEYEKRFWDSSIRFAWSDEELERSKKWIKGISLLNEVTNSNNLIMATVAGKEAIEMEQMTEENIAEDLTEMLRKFTGDVTIPYPVCLYRTKWAQDPHFFGSGSYLSTSSSLDHLCTLGSTLIGQSGLRGARVLFAGEATSPGRIGTVLGARISGLREAERIISLTRAFNGPPPLLSQCYNKEFEEELPHHSNLALS